MQLSSIKKIYLLCGMKEIKSKEMNIIDLKEKDFEKHQIVIRAQAVVLNHQIVKTQVNLQVNSLIT